MSAGPWRAITGPDGEHRRDAGGVTLAVAQYDPGVWFWEAIDGDHRPVVGCNYPTLPAAMEAADLWASENGYPAVRVDVDP
jgi:hypothetical protein